MQDLVRYYNGIDRGVFAFLDWMNEELEKNPYSLVTPHGHVYKKFRPGDPYHTYIAERKTKEEFLFKGTLAEITEGEESIHRLVYMNENIKEDELPVVFRGQLEVMEKDAQRLLKEREFSEQKLEYVVEDHPSGTRVWNPIGEIIFEASI